MAELVAHAFADVFPLMRGEEYEALKADIAAHGVRQPIVLHDGRIVDGRNRYRACKELKIEPPTRILRDGTPIVEFIISANLHRRHLDANQKAMVAAEIEPMLAAEAKARQKEHAGTAPGKKADTLSKNGKSEPIHAAKIAAERVGVSRGYVSDAKKLKREAPDLAEKVVAGELTIPKAKKEAVRREATKGLPPGKTPHQEAREDAGRRWHQNLYKLSQLLNSIRDCGGIKKLAGKWSKADRADNAAELRRIIGELEKQVELLESFE